MKRKSIFCTIVAVVLILTVFSTSAFALTVPDFTWDQNGIPTLILTNTQRQTSNGTLVFDGSASAPVNAAFKIRLEKQNMFGGWDQVGPLRTGEQGPGSAYHRRLGKNVPGMYFRTVWTGLSTSAHYRIALIRLDNEKWQSTKFREVRIDIR